MTRILALLVTIFVTAMSAHAHTISIGYDNSGQGAATFWYGSYHTGTNFTEGTFNLVGVNGNPFPSTTVPFNLLVSTKPSGLIDGVNNFYANRSSSNGLPNLPTNTTGLGNVTVWQGVRFTGLAAGSYQFTYIPKVNPTANWAPITAGIQSSVVNITAAQLIAAPVADAGPDVTVNPGAPVTLNGTGSHDVNSPLLPITSYAWTQVSGVAVTLSNANTATASFTAPAVPPAGATLVFKLTVSNGQSSVPGTDTISVNVRGNQPPVASAGVSRSVFDADVNDVPTVVALDGTASYDPEGAALTYAWTQTGGPAVALANPAGATPSFTAPSLANHPSGVPQPIVLSLHLNVSDGTLTTGADVTITVRHNNLIPVADASATTAQQAEGTVTLNGSLSSDPDQDPLTFTWAQTGGTPVTIAPNGTNASSSSFDYTIDAPHSNAGETLTFTLTVSDGIASSSVPVAVFVQNVNHAPMATTIPVPAVFDNVGLVALDGFGSDSDGDAVNLRWTQVAGPAVVLNDATTGDPSFTAPPVSEAQGSVTLTFQLIANDSFGAGDTAALDSAPATVDVLVKHHNRAPVADAGHAQDVPEQTVVTLDGSGSYDPDMDALTYAWVQTAGPYVGLLDNTDPVHPKFTGPNVGPAGVTLTFQLIVTDSAPAGSGGDLSSQPSTVNINVKYVNQPPVADAGAAQAANEGAVVALTGSGSDPDGNTFTFAWTQTGGPLVALSDVTAAQPSFTAPPVDRFGATLTFALQTKDQFNALSNVATTSVVIGNINQAPTADAGLLQSVPEGTPAGLAGAGLDLDTEEQPLLTYAWVQTAGPVVILTGANTTTPSFTAPLVTAGGNPNASVTLKFQLTVTDPNNAPATATTCVTVTNVDHAPLANAGGVYLVNEAAVLTLNGNGSTDPDNDPLTYAWVQTAGVPVTLVNANTATPSFTAPFVNAAGTTLKFTLTVNDGFSGISSDTATVSVQNINDPPTLVNPRASVACLWPPNHQMVPISILGVVDSNNNAVIRVTSVTQDEATNGLGDGDTAIDAIINADGTVLLRAERSGKGNGRVYHIRFTASDLEGSVSGMVTVCVPHSKKTDIAIDGGELFDSTR